MSRQQITRQTLRLWTFKPTPTIHLSSQIKDGSCVLRFVVLFVVKLAVAIAVLALVAQLIFIAIDQSLERPVMVQNDGLLSLMSFAVKRLSLSRALYKSYTFLCRTPTSLKDAP